MNDIEIDINNWKYYLNTLNITTNSRWLSNTSTHPMSGNFIIPKRDFLPKPDKNHHGIWIAEIPYQMILRFSTKNDIIWSQFGGSGIDKEVCDILNRKCYINDINPKRSFIDSADSLTVDLSLKIGQKANLILSHPPYWDIVKYSDNENDGSNQKTLKDFLDWWNNIIINSYKNLEDNGYLIFAAGNIYKNSEEIELGNLMLLLALNNGFILKQHIIKDYGETKGKEAKNYNINYYRQLKGHYGNFYGDNIYILKKGKSKNNIIDTLRSIIFDE